MSFETYEQVRPWAPLISLKVMKREMPPYAYDHGIGIQDLQGDWRLSQKDIDTVVEWVDTGARYGDPDIVVQPVNLARSGSMEFRSRLWRAGRNHRQCGNRHSSKRQRLVAQAQCSNRTN